jgi:YkoY family integral membrane protein
MYVMLVEYAAILGTLILMEGILAADNALVLAVLVSRLPDRTEQRKALLYGIVGAFFFRAVAVVAATWLIKLWYFKAGGALYLLWITAHYFISGAHKQDMAAASADPSEIAAAKSATGKVAKFWPIVVMVELTDIAFSVDQIVAAVSLSDEMWVVYTGGMLGIIAMRFAAGGFLVLIEKRPMLAYTGHILPAWIGVKLAFKTLEAAPFNLPIHLSGWIFWSVMAALVAWGLLRKPARFANKDENNDTAGDNVSTNKSVSENA